MRIREKLQSLDKMYPAIPILILALTFAAVPRGSVYGSEGDWISQHLALAQQFRSIFYETGALLPEYSWLGAGSNLYQFSYYGFLRPDVLLSFLFPEVEMYVFLIGYAVFSRILAAVFFHFWMGGKGLSGEVRILGTLSFIFASCFWHSHHQIMFVSFLPWLILGCVMIERLGEGKGRAGFTAAVVLTAFHSYFFLPGCVAVWSIYFLFCHGIRRKKEMAGYVFSGILAAGISMVLLLPTLLVLLEHTKDVKPTSMGEIFSADLDFSSILYTPYGCGLTLFSLFCVFSGLWNRSLRKLCLALLALHTLPIVSFLFNGGLYIRDKAFIPFLPILLYVVVVQLNQAENWTRKQIFFSCLLCVVPILLQKEYQMWITIEIFLYFVVSLVFWKTKQKKVLLFFCLPAMILQITLDQTETYVSKETLKKEEIVSEIEYDQNFRMDFLENPFDQANVQYLGNQKKVSMYSSSTNRVYNEYFFDLAENPVRIRNRVAMLAESNPLFLENMGVRYLLTDPDKIPAGYVSKKEEGGIVLAENEKVKPLLYGNGKTLSLETFEGLTLPEKLLAQYQYVLTDAPGTEEEAAEIQKTVTPLIREMSVPELEKAVDQTKKTREILSIPRVEEDEILVVEFQVENETAGDVEITINGIRNKLSGSSAPYPNRNHQFIYQISSNRGFSQLEMDLSAGKYRIENCRVWKLQIPEPEYQTPEWIRTQGNSGIVAETELVMEESGFLVTSFPSMKGYTLVVNGEEKEIEEINGGFVGCSLEEGTYQIRISYHAPGRDAGLGISVVSSLLFAAFLCAEWRKRQITQGMKYLVVGVMTTLVNYLVYGYLLTVTAYLAANSAAWFLAVLFSWYANRRFVFQSTEPIGKEILQFFLARLGSLLAETLLLLCMIEILHLPDVLSKISIGTVVIGLNYIFCKKKIFRSNRNAIKTTT